MSKLALCWFTRFENVLLKKDVGLFPIYLKKYFEEVFILYFTSKDDETIPQEYKGCKFICIDGGGISEKMTSPLKDIFLANKFCSYFKHHKDISHILVFHWGLEHLYFASKIKKINPCCKIWMKLDSSIDGAERIIYELGVPSKTPFRKYLRKHIQNAGIKAVDLFSAETKIGVSFLKDKTSFSNKIFYIPNGYDDTLLFYESREKPIYKKEKTIITVARLGTYQKNTELLLKILKEANLRDWNVKLIGSVEETFLPYLDSFFAKNPLLKEKIQIIGNISDEEQLLQEYQKASVFIFTSRFESFGLSILEAGINGCYIISTDVGAIRDISTSNNFCYISPESTYNNQNENVILHSMANELQKIIDGNKDIQKTVVSQVECLYKEFLMSNIIQIDCLIDWVK